MSDLALGLGSLIDAMPDYEEARAYYTGDVEPVFGRSMAKQLAKSGYSNIKVNLAKIAVDAVADRLEVSSIATGDERSQEALDALTVVNEFDTVLPTLFRDALMYGDMYLMLDQDEDGTVNLFPNDPLTTRVIYSSENPRLKSFAIKRFVCAHTSGKGTAVRVNLYYPDRVERYITNKVDGKGVKPDEFIPYTTADESDTDHIVENAYGFIPVYHLRTARNYGVPTHRAGYGCQDSINKIVVTHLASIDYLGFPQRYIINGPDTDGTDVDDFDLPEFHDAENPQASESGPSTRAGTGLTADPGTVQMLPPGTSTGQFEPASSENFISSMSFYIKLMAQTTNTPMHYFDPSGDVPSGESLRVADAPLVKRAKSLALLFAGALQDALGDALSVLDVEANPMVTWANPESTDDASTWAVAKARMDVGVDQFDALQMAGLTAEQVEAMGITHEQAVADAETDRRVSSLARLSAAIAPLASAVSAGVLDAGTAADLIAQALTDTEQAA